MSGLCDYMNMHGLETRVDVQDALNAIRLTHSNPKCCNDGSIYREVIYRRFWLNQTLEDVAFDLGKSRGRIQQIEKKALHLLRYAFATERFANRKGN